MAPAEAFEGGAGEMEAEVASELESPFRSAMTFGETEGAAYPEAEMGPTTLESPFQSSFAEVSESETATEAFRELLAELESEQFDESVAQLVDEAAGLHLASGDVVVLGGGGPGSRARRARGVDRAAEAGNAPDARQHGRAPRQRGARNPS